MKTQFDQQLLSSFYLWFENHLVGSKVEAYSTGVNNVYRYVAAYDIPTGYNAYQGAFRQLVAESDVSVPNSGCFVNGSFITGNSSLSNVYTDFNNGRIIFPASSGKALTVTSKSTVKEVNTYITNDDEEQLILHGDFCDKNDLTNPYLSNKTNKLDEKTYFLPACFISLANSDNEEFAFGGEEETKTRIRVMVLAKDNYTMDGVLSAFRDTARSTIINIPFEEFPYGKFFSIKNFPYRYSNLKNAHSSIAANRVSIEDVSTSRVNASAIKKLGKDFLIGFIDFDLSTYRFPRL
jgi:hypothetical protein